MNTDVYIKLKKEKLVMEIFFNLNSLISDMKDKQWHITAFTFRYKDINYVVLVEDIENLKMVIDNHIALLSFIDTTDENHVLQVKVSPYGFDIGAKKLREFFGIEWNENLGDIFKQFYSLLNAKIPPKVDNDKLSADEEQEIINRLNKNDNDFSRCCFKIRRNPSGQHRTVFNADKTKILRPSLYEKFANDNTISFCYRENDELTDSEICLAFAKACKK